MADFYLDTREGPGISYDFSIEYEQLKNIGKNPDGLEKFLYFSTTPWTSLKQTFQYIGTKSFWDEKIESMKNDYFRLASSNTGIYIDSVSVDDKLIINNLEYYSGSISQTDYRNSIGIFPSVYNLVEINSGNYPVNGHFTEQHFKSNLERKSLLSAPNYGEIITKTYTSAEPQDFIGEEKTIAGITGIISSVSSSNERYINGIKVKDYNVQLSANLATDV
jgi:hypothetical protein